VILIGLLALAAVGCVGPGDETAELSMPGDTLPPPEIEVGLAIDSAASGEGSPPPSVAPDSTRADSIAADSLAAPADSLDPVLVAIERLSREVEELRALQLEQGPVDSASTGADAPGGVLREAGAEARNWGVRLAVGLFVLLVFGFIIRVVTRSVEVLAERTATRRLLLKRLVPIVRILFWVVAIYFVIGVVLGVDAQGLVAAGAAIGVAVGFAAQDILKNVFGGLIVIFDQPFQVGDKVSVGGTYGEVVSIGLRSTKIVTPDDNLVTVPNAQLVDHQVANANAGELNCQVVTDLYLPGDVDEAKAKALAREAAVSSEYVYLRKPVVVLVKDEFKETFLLHVRVKAYVLDPRLEFLFQSDVTERARAAFRDAGLIAEDYRFGDGSSRGDAEPGPSDHAWERLE
jgi:small-conductance mechanosensitive channel